MNDAVTDTGNANGTLAYSDASNPVYKEGRRSFFKYRELGVTDATNGRMRAQVTSCTQGLGKPTGWHYHVCEHQLVFMLKGWVDLEFEDGTKVRLKAGDSLMIPGGMRHNETATADELELLEVSVPAEMKTVVCDPPPGRT
ncbi:cupin domain-containing protein [Rhodopila sp.]|jgi:quercetin dioxygenase-like cupin family protein|uniref:cupin domain-containing protein n=1 Tax=Rhodopila sp. TaxID=2480087 RepID=UPI002B514E62|nr:cupin domain-containing protein [Rhodopila sp.]HVZ07535.1 cupin domain-containing protein [Rhodopila sp.]